MRGAEVKVLADPRGLALARVSVICSDRQTKSVTRVRAGVLFSLIRQSLTHTLDTPPPHTHTRVRDATKPRSDKDGLGGLRR